MKRHTVARFGLTRAAALALASPTVDLRITQVANDVWACTRYCPAPR